MFSIKGAIEVRYVSANWPASASRHLSPQYLLVGVITLLTLSYSNAALDAISLTRNRMLSNRWIFGICSLRVNIYARC